MSPDGVPYFGGSYLCPMGRTCDFAHKDEKILHDPSLLSGLFTVIMSMAEISGGKLQEISFEKFRVLLKSADNLIMVMGIDPSEDVEDYKNRLKLSIEIFLQNYKKYLPDKANKTSLFNSFQTHLEEANIFDDLPKYRKNCIDCEIDRDCMFRMVTSPLNVDPIEKMEHGKNRYPKFTLLIMWSKEFFNYLKQYKAFKNFKKQYKKAKERDPEVEIIFFD